MCPAGFSDSRPCRQVHGVDTLDDRLQILAMELEHQDLACSKNDTVESFDEVVRHLICGELLGDFMPAAEEANLHVNGLEVGRRRGDGLDSHFVASERESDPLPLGSRGTNSSRLKLAGIILSGERERVSGFITDRRVR